MLKHLFGKLKKTKKGNHKTKFSSSGVDDNLNIKGFEYGDPLDRILLTESLKNAIISSGENDLTLKERRYCSLGLKPQFTDEYCADD